MNNASTFLIILCAGALVLFFMCRPELLDNHPSSLGTNTLVQHHTPPSDAARLDAVEKRLHDICSMNVLAGCP